MMITAILVQLQAPNYRRGRDQPTPWCRCHYPPSKKQDLLLLLKHKKGDLMLQR